MSNGTINYLLAQSVILFGNVKPIKIIDKKEISPIKKYLLEQNRLTKPKQ